MYKKELTCIGCPMGCSLEVELEGDIVKKVSGNTCKIGENYAVKECTNPMRIVTSSVAVIGGDIDMVSVKTEKDIPKDKIMDCIKELKNVHVSAPINIGTVIFEDVAKTGVNVIATRKVNKK